MGGCCQSWLSPCGGLYGDSGDCYGPWASCLNYLVIWCGSDEQNNEAISIIGYVIKKKFLFRSALQNEL